MMSGSPSHFNGGYRLQDARLDFTENCELSLDELGLNVMRLRFDAIEYLFECYKSTLGGIFFGEPWKENHDELKIIYERAGIIENAIGRNYDWAQNFYSVESLDQPAFRP